MECGQLVRAAEILFQKMVVELMRLCHFLEGGWVLGRNQMRVHKPYGTDSGSEDLGHQE